MLRAATKGCVDFSKARLLDPAWWRGLRLVLSDLERTITIEAAQLFHHNQISLVGLIAADNSLRQDTLDSAFVALQTALQALRPWEKVDPKKAADQQAKELSEQYKEALGDPNDPEYRRQINLLIDELKNRRRKVESEAEKQHNLRRQLLDRKVKSR